MDQFNFNWDDINTVAASLGVLSPFVTAILNKARQPEWFQGLISVTLAAVVGVAMAAFADGNFDWATAATNGVTVWVAGLLTWLGVSKQAVSALNQKTASFGLRLPAPKVVAAPAPAPDQPVYVPGPSVVVPPPLPADDPEVQEALLLASQRRIDFSAEAEATGRTIQQVSDSVIAGAVDRFEELGIE